MTREKSIRIIGLILQIKIVASILLVTPSMEWLLLLVALFVRFWVLFRNCGAIDYSFS